MKVSQLVRELERAGCYLKRHGARHDWYYSPITGESFAVERHKNKEVAIGTLKKIKALSGIK
jgi:predicted RNA binding protein YcfA (HicA-like mRNA interferase family)